MDGAEGLSAFCPYYHHAIEVIGRRWTGAILRAMLAGVERFSDLKCSIPELSDRMLSERLKELEQEGIVERIVIPDTPVRVAYRLTPKGHDLHTVIASLSTWAHEWLVAPEVAASGQPPADAPVEASAR